MSGLGLGGYYGYQWWQNQELQKTRPTVVKAKDGTNINAAWHKLCLLYTSDAADD